VHKTCGEGKEARGANSKEIIANGVEGDAYEKKSGRVRMGKKTPFILVGALGEDPSDERKVPVPTPNVSFQRGE